MPRLSHKWHTAQLPCPISKLRIPALPSCVGYQHSESLAQWENRFIWLGGCKVWNNLGHHPTDIIGYYFFSPLLNQIGTNPNCHNRTSLFAILRKILGYFGNMSLFGIITQQYVKKWPRKNAQESQEFAQESQEFAQECARMRNIFLATQDAKNDSC